MLLPARRSRRGRSVDGCEQSPRERHPATAAGRCQIEHFESKAKLRSERAADVRVDEVVLDREQAVCDVAIHDALLVEALGLIRREQAQQITNKPPIVRRQFTQQ